MFDLSTFELFILTMCGFLVGFSKTAGTTLSSIIIPIMSDVFPAKEATGILSLAFFAASFHAIYYFRHAIEWKYFTKLLPGVMVGFGIGAWYMQQANNEVIKLTIGFIILGLLAVNVFRSHYLGFFNRYRSHNGLAHLLAIIMGFSSMIANSGSPILALYLIMQDTKKAQVIGTLATFFFFTDLIKIPVSIFVGVVTMDSLKLNGIMLPFMLVGGCAGIVFVKWISEQKFARMLEVITFTGGVKLIYGPLMLLI